MNTLQMFLRMPLKTGRGEEMTTLADFGTITIEELPLEEPSGKKVEFVGKLTWPELRNAVIIEFENDPDTKIFLQPGQDNFERVSCWKVIKNA